MHPAPTAPRAALTPTTPGRLVAWWSLAAAVLYVVGIYAPFITISGTDTHISDGGTDNIIALLIPACLAALGAVIGLLGNPAGSIVGAGAAGGGAGWAITTSTFAWWLLHEDTDEVFGFGADVGYGIGFFALVGACVAAVIALVGGLAASRDAVKGTAPNPMLATLAGLALVGVPLSILLPENGFSNFDFPDDAVKASIVAWAVLAPLVGFVAALGRSRGGVVLALGVALGHVGIVIALARNDFAVAPSAENFPVMREWLYAASIVAAIVLCVLALVFAPAAVTTAHIDVEHAPRPAGVMAPPPVVDMSTTAVAGKWDEDPFGRHQQRWWDGHRWTDRVMDNLVESRDDAAWPTDDGPHLPT